MNKHRLGTAWRAGASLGVLACALSRPAPAQEAMGAIERQDAPAVSTQDVVQPSAQEPVEVITLEQAVERAIRYSPAVAQASGAVENAEWTRRTAWGAFLPSLSVSSGASLRSSQRWNDATQTYVTAPSSDRKSVV